MKQNWNRILPFLMAVLLWADIMPVRAAATDTGDSISVSFRLIGDTYHEEGVVDHGEYVTWIPTTLYTVEPGATVCDVFLLAMEEYGLKQKGATGGYVEAIRAPATLGEYWLYEFDNGPNSGWMYTVNGVHSGVGLTACVLQAGDQIVWHYVDDYVLEERNPGSSYYQRWMEAEDIAPEEYLWNSCRLDTVSEGKYNLSIPAVSQDLMILVAGYHTTGQMIECQVLERKDFQWEPGTSASKTLSIHGERVKAFVLNADAYTLVSLTLATSR